MPRSPGPLQPPRPIRSPKGYSCQHLLDYGILGRSSIAGLSKASWGFAMRPDRPMRVQPPRKRQKHPRTAAKIFERSSSDHRAHSELRLRTNGASAPDEAISPKLPNEASGTHPPRHTILRELIHRALSFREASEFLPIAMPLVAGALGTERAAFLRLSPDGLSLEFQAGFGWKQNADGQVKLDAGPGSGGRFILDSGSPVIFEGPLDEGEILVTSWFNVHGVGHGIASPVRVGNATYGVLAAHTSNPRRFTTEDLRVLAQSACIISLHIQRALNRRRPLPARPHSGISVEGFQEASEWLSARLWERSVELKKANEDLRREVAERQRAESDLQLLVEVTAAASEASDLAGMLSGCLESVCRLRGCAVGQAWLVNSQHEVLECTPEAWQAARETAGVAELRQRSLALRLNRGEGLPGVVWESGKPAWLEGPTDSTNLPLRWREAQQARLRSAFAFPVTSGGRLVAVLEFFLAEAQLADGRLLNTLAHLGTHLGVVFERLQREADLRRHRAFIDRLIRSSPEGIFAFDPECRLTVWNPGMERIFGVSEGEALGRSAFDVLPFLREIGEDRLFREALEGRTAAAKERPYRLVTGSDQGFFDSYYSPIWEEGGAGDEARRVIGGLAIVHDITERRRAAEALRLSEERFRTLVQDVKDYAIFMLDPEGRVRSWNRGAERIKGYRSEEIIGRHFSVFYPDEDVHSVDPEQVLKIAAAEGRFETEGWRVRKDGSRFWAHVIVTALRDDNGNLRGFTKVTRDVTEHKQAEQKLRESEDRLRAILNNSPNLIFLKDTEGRYLLVNKEFECALRLTQEEVRGKTDREIFPLEMAQSFEANDLQVLQKGMPLEFEEVSLQEDGPHTSIVHKFPLRDEGGDIYALGGLATDITERMQTAQALREMSNHLLRLQDEERRRIARELHDSTAQTLTAAGLSLARLQFSAPALSSRASAALAESQELIKQAAQEIRSVAYLLHPPDLRSGGLASGLETYARGFSNRTGVKVSVDTPAGLNHLPEEAALALYRVAQECLSNIHRHSGSRTAAIRLKLEGDEARLEVTDRGGGMSAGVLDGSGAQLGVGIPGMRGRLSQLGGKLEILSGAKGTTVVARLPLAGRGNGLSSPRKDS
jgi:PAS domain S-box-containing protein